MNPTSLDAITPNTLDNNLNQKDNKVKVHDQNFSTSTHPTVGSLTTSVDKATHGLTGNPHSSGLTDSKHSTEGLTGNHNGHHTGNDLTGHHTGNNLTGDKVGVHSTNNTLTGNHNGHHSGNGITGHHTGSNLTGDKVGVHSTNNTLTGHDTGAYTTDNKLGNNHAHNNVNNLNNPSLNNHSNPHNDKVIGSNQNTGVLADNPVKYPGSNPLDGTNSSFTHDKVIGSNPNTSTNAGVNNGSLHDHKHTGAGLDKRHGNSTDISSHGKVVGGLENKHSVTSTTDRINNNNNIEGTNTTHSTNPSKLSHPVAGESLENYPVAGDKVQNGHHTTNTTTGLGAANGHNTGTKHNTSQVGGQNTVPHTVNQNNNHHNASTTANSTIPSDVKPSKVGGTLEKIKGSVQTTAGKVLGSANLKESGAESKLEGQAKIEAAKLEKEQKQAIH